WPKPVDRRTPLAAVVAWSVVGIVGVGVFLTMGYVPWQHGVTAWSLVTVAVVALIIGGPGARTLRPPAAVDVAAAARAA
ncbi:MAG: hypothetical protein HOQ00_11670, partial [Agromyces sp.]|nr:hypothetical protein [Agromyces sp.]